MHRALVVGRKEVLELLGNKAAVGISVGFAVFFSVMYSLRIAGAEGVASQSLAQTTLFYVPAAIAVFVAYYCVAQVFLLEKREKVIETLMCAPVTLRDIWLGKMLGVTSFAWVVCWLATVLVLAIPTFLGKSLLPGPPVAVNVVVVVPLFVAGLVGLVGIAQLLLGMRETRILNFVLFIPVFIALYGSGSAVTENLVVGWQHIGVLFGASCALLALAAYLTRFLSKERIVLTIP
ncbi:MAG: hypothetical protein ACOC6A_06240 [Chloroflexota bacterium]